MALKRTIINSYKFPAASLPPPGTLLKTTYDWSCDRAQKGEIVMIIDYFEEYDIKTGFRGYGIFMLRKSQVEFYRTLHKDFRSILSYFDVL